jgi:hypothetical protein
MPTLSISGHDVEVDESFLKLSPDKQNATVEEIAKTLPKDASKKAETPDTSTFLGEVEHGLADPIAGSAQLLEHAVPKQVSRDINWLNNQLSKAGLTKELPLTNATDEFNRQREQQIQAERGGSQSLDPGRIVGNILSPMNYIGAGGAIPRAVEAAAPRIAAAAKPVISGMIAGAEQPITEKAEFGPAKAEQIGIGGLAGGVTAGAFGLASKAASKVGEFVAREWPESLKSDAIQRVLRRMNQDEKGGGPSAVALIKLVNDIKNGPWGPKPDAKPKVFADVAGENVRGLAGNVSRQPGPARSLAKGVMEGRDQQAQARLDADIARTLHGGDSMHKTGKMLLQARSAAARPAYDATHALQNVWSPRLQQFLEDPAVMSGMKRGYEIERLQALAEGRPITTTQLGVDLDTEGNVKLLATPNMRILDMGKQGLDAMITDERNEITGRLSSRGVALEKVRHAYVDEMDNLDTKGIYKNARKVWQGFSASMDAMKLGRAAFRMNPEEIAEEVGKMSEGDRDFYRVGVADALRERLARTGFKGDEAKALIKNNWMQQQLRPAFKSRAEFDEFVDAVTDERQMFESGAKMLGNSATAGRVAEDISPDNMDKYGRLALHAAKGNIFSAAKNAYQMWRDLGAIPNEKLNTEVAKILFTADLPPDVAQALQTGVVPQAANPAAGAAAGLQTAGRVAAPAVAAGVTPQ